MERIMIAAILAFSPGIASAARIVAAFESKSVPGTMKVYELSDPKAATWTMATVPKLAKAPVKEEIPGGAIELEPGQSKKFVLIYENATDKTVNFFAAPHVANPVENALGFKFKCLCINHAFKVPPKQTWFRVVEFKLDKGFKGKELTLTHTLLAADEVSADDAKDMEAHDH